MIKANYINKRIDNNLYYFDLYFTETVEESEEEITLLSLGGVYFDTDPTEEDLLQRATNIAHLNDINFNPSNT